MPTLNARSYVSDFYNIIGATKKIASLKKQSHHVSDMASQIAGDSLVSSLSRITSKGASRLHVHYLPFVTEIQIALTNGQ